MKIEDKKNLIHDIYSKKKEIMLSKLKLSSGDHDSVKKIKNTKKEVARLFTILNSI